MYKQRDTSSLGPFYSDHFNALLAHDIVGDREALAAELAVRDIVIENLGENLQTVTMMLRAAHPYIQGVRAASKHAPPDSKLQDAEFIRSLDILVDLMQEALEELCPKLGLKPIAPREEPAQLSPEEALHRLLMASE